ncbi:MAG: DinB family protein [Gemmatimonadaceae bacterium]
MSEAERSAAALDRVHDGDPWHGPSRAAVLKGVTAAEAAFRPAPDAHSIWAIVLHMRSWTREVTRRARGGVSALPEDGDWPPPPPPTAAAWRECLQSLDAAHAELAALVRGLSDEELSARVKPRPGESAPGISIRGMIRSLGEHDIYHTGQVAMLKRLARNAPPGHSSG